MEKNVGQRLIIILAAVLVAALLLRDPRQTLRPGLDIAGGASLIFEIDATGSEDNPELAERVKELLQKRVDPQGVYDLSWRVQGRNRIEVQMPLPPSDAKARQEAYQQSLKELYDHELTRAPILRALQLTGDERAEALRALAVRNAEDARRLLDYWDAAKNSTNVLQDPALAALREAVGPGGAQALAGMTPEAVQAVRDEVAAGVEQRRQLLEQLAERYDAYVAARLARDQAAAPTQESATTAPTTAPDNAELQLQYRDALELYEDAMQAVLSTNLNRRRFEEILALEGRSQVRQKSLAQLKAEHADLRLEMESVVARHTEWREGKRFLDGPGDLKRLLRGSGRLEFRILVDPDPGNPTIFNDARTQLKEQGREKLPDKPYSWFQVDNPMQFFNLNSPAELESFNYEQDSRYVVERFGEQFYVLAKTSPDDGLLQEVPNQRKWRLNRARIDRDQHGRWCVTFELDIIGGQLFEDLTRRNIGKPLCILVDDIAYSAPNIQSVIRTHGQITGEFSLEKVNYLVRSMEGGTLPARLKDTPLSERTIGSSLGESNRDSAVRAGLYGGIAVVVVMMGYYWTCGAVATVALLLNVLLLLSAMAMLNARITLVGIAGIILSIGMAVDANVLIYERMREEKERGASLRMIIKNGYDKALSTIVDSNITTLLTCVIIYYVGSEEVKGFGLTLGWGIVLNLFTSIFVTRTLFMLMTKYGLIRDIKMARIIGVPNIDWYGKRWFFIPMSLLFMALGLFLLYERGKDNFLDVEFLGGVTAEFGVVEEAAAQVDDRYIAAQLEQIGRGIEEDITRLAGAEVTTAPGEPGAFLVRVPGVHAERLLALIGEPLEEIQIEETLPDKSTIERPLLQRGGLDTVPATEQVKVLVQGEVTAETLAQRIHGLATSMKSTGDNLARATVNAVLEAGGVAQGSTWNITSTVTNMHLVQYALETALGEQMDVQPSVEYVFQGEAGRPFPVADELPETIATDLPPGVNIELTDYLGGAAIYLDELNPPQSVEALTARLNNMHFQPDFQDLPKRRFGVSGVRPAEDTDPAGNPLYKSVVIAVTDPDIRYTDDPEQWFVAFAADELRLAQSALESEQTLRKVMQFKPQIAARSTQQASMALLLSWGMIIGYLWIRFGRPMYGIAGVVALIHDVLIALAFIGISGWIGGKDHPIGNFLLISDFKINMTIIAALLTIIGYSINDTIVVFDRIRETRGRLGMVTPEIINASINQTLSRTLMTSFTTIVVLVIMYIWGGGSIRGFNACMIVGIVTGSYSSIAVAAPLLMLNVAKRLAGAPARA